MLPGGAGQNQISCLASVRKASYPTTALGRITERDRAFGHATDAFLRDGAFRIFSFVVLSHVAHRRPRGRQLLPSSTKNTRNQLFAVYRDGTASFDHPRKAG